MLDHRKPTLPNFLIVGAAKCGMSSLYYYLKQHPDVFMSGIKEPDFFFAQFSQIPTSGRGDDCLHIVKEYDEYRRLFASAGNHKAIGESSHTNLYYYHKTIPLIKQYLGDPKIIIILRNPVDRAYAAFSELTLEGREFLPFEEALQVEPTRRAEGWRTTWYYRDLGFYTHQVKAFIEHFSMVKVCLFDDLQRDAGSLMQDLYRFLEVDATFTPDLTTDYAFSGAPRFRLLKSLFRRKPPLQSIVGFFGKMLFGEDRWASIREKLKGKLLAKTTAINPATKCRLENDYRDDINKLQGLINRDLGLWLQDSVHYR